ncbi:uncharacterized protein A4U43_C09F6240 [Asparagus officinalis]|uniref:Protein kinase domain-containing protein n=1 Tax=Asparagus officinalis TaxID=4686 RepID=A0A5P1E5P9_ASPOF|nr:uncharacterized protein A4U43_C09F6240 [Asparagus officinalis]
MTAGPASRASSPRISTPTAHLSSAELLQRPPWASSALLIRRAPACESHRERPRRSSPDPPLLLPLRSQHPLPPLGHLLPPIHTSPLLQTRLSGHDPSPASASLDFHPDYIVVTGSSRIGTAYHAILRDGSALTVKRLYGCLLSEKQFRDEMGRMA